jgi:hypothetical protein
MPLVAVGRMIWIGLALLWLAAPATASADRTVHLYEVQHRLAEELLPVARAGLAERGRASLDARTNALLLVGDAAAVADAVALLRDRDRPPRTVLLHHRMERTADLLDRGARIAWSVGGGPVRIGNVRWPPGAPAQIAVGLHDAGTRRESEFRGSLRLLEGSTGILFVGSEVPVAVGDRRRPAVAMVAAPSGFRATPRILGDGRVQVDLAPIHSEVDARGRVAFDTVETTVIAQPGETVAIAGIAANEATQGSGSGLRHTDALDTRLLLLSVEVEPASGR